MHITRGAITKAVIGTRLVVSSSVLVAGLMSIAIPASAQGVRGTGPTHLFAVVGGQFIDDVNEENGPVGFGGIRAGQELGRFFLAEATASYMATSTSFIDIPGGIRATSTPFTSADIGLEAQLPLGPLAPYIGAAIGAYHRSGTDDVEREQGLSRALMGGARLRFAHRYFAQGEVKIRRDEYSFGRTINAQYVYGLGVRF